MLLKERICAQKGDVCIFIRVDVNICFTVCALALCPSSRCCSRARCTALRSHKFVSISVSVSRLCLPVAKFSLPLHGPRRAAETELKIDFQVENRALPAFFPPSEILPPFMNIYRHFYLKPELKLEGR